MDVEVAPVEGDTAAVIDEKRKMIIFGLDQVPEMTRGRGVRLQRYAEKGLSDVITFPAKEGLTWFDKAGRTFNTPLRELANWRGNRADAGRIAPDGFPRNNKFGRVPIVGKNGDKNGEG